jgi:glycerol kinase
MCKRSELSPILSIDQGTSATKACVFEAPGSLLGQATIPVGRRTLADGGVEQDPAELVESCVRAARGALGQARITAADLDGVALANQGESFLLFGESGIPYGPVVGWQDTRCGDVIDGLAATGASDLVEERTGLPLHAEFSAPKLAFRLRSGEVPDDALFGTLDTWLIHQLDPSRPHVTDRATASRTMLVALDDPDWSDDLLELFGVPRRLLPRVVDCDAVPAMLCIEGHEVPLVASGFDMGLALLGHGCLAPGETKATFGTCLGVMSVADGPAGRPRGLLTTIAYTLQGSSRYALDGEIAAAGSLVDWAIGLGIARTFEELEQLARSVPDAGGAVLVPATTGLGAPHWRDDVRARLVGMTGTFGRGQFARAVLDAIAWSLADVVEALEAAGLDVAALHVDGGLAASRLLLQRCADCAGVPLVRSAQEEATAFGAAALGMLAAGQARTDEIAAAARGTDVTEPRALASNGERERWQEAVEATLSARSPVG